MVFNLVYTPVWWKTEAMGDNDEYNGENDKPVESDEFEVELLWLVCIQQYTLEN